MKNAAVVVLLSVLFAAALGARAAAAYAGNPASGSSGDLNLRINTHEYRSGRVASNVNVIGEISYDTIDAIRNGITANLQVTFQVLKVRGLFESGKEVMGQRTKTYTISYDVWENRFVLTDKTRKRDHLADTPHALVREFGRVVNPLVVPLPSPGKGSRYMVRARIKIQTIKLFPPFGLFLYFFDPWNYDSDWVYSEVFSIEAAQE